jgi:hypothetical protein
MSLAFSRIIVKKTVHFAEANSYLIATDARREADGTAVK